MNVAAVPAPSVPDVVEEAGTLGCGGAVVYAAGFREGGDAALEADLRAAALRHSPPVCGPNCDGLVALHSRAALWGDALAPGVPGDLTVAFTDTNASETHTASASIDDACPAAPPVVRTSPHAGAFGRR